MEIKFERKFYIMKKIELDKPITYRGLIRLSIISTIISGIGALIYVISMLDLWSEIGDKIIDVKNKIFKKKSKKIESA